ncbi:MAG: nitrous oxide reductase accessory protein NosL [Rhodospirillales bacterium]|nr:nitrous oxide reductase accessory protein NosL [Alphaproteobacteria bacterium]MBL6948610.1 nitrous oxide reductase accessory protein NosL [Rhodospirillales bacterium]
MAAACLCAGFLSACGDQTVAEAPPPQEPTRAATGHYCSMTVVDHPGPKGQIHLEGDAHPLWFSSVRDTIAFTMLPEESKDIAAIYVNDMAQVKTWKQPEPKTWIRARDAWYVIGSSRRGGMGAPEAVPFGDRDKAQSFAGEHGGRVVAFKDIPPEAILGNANDSSGKLTDNSSPDAGHGAAGMNHKEHRP